MTESFEDAIKALRHIARGNGSVLRIADRIVAAHERDTKVEGVCGPITGELRAAMRQWGWVESDGSITFATSPLPPSIDVEQSLAISGSDFDRYCDAIDSIHAQLERENESLKAELNRVLGEQEEHAHTRGESITGELREVAAKTECANGRCEKLYRGDLERIADCIDVEHKRAVMSAMNDALYHANDESMAELGWVRLPKDADGVPIHFKDKVTVPWSDKVYEVSGFSYQENVHIGTMTIWINTHVDGEYRALCATDSCHHHQPDTWESIIEEVLQRGHDDYPLNVDIEPYVARCKKLAGDAK